MDSKNETSFTFGMPIDVKNALIGLSAKRKQTRQAKSSIKEIILEMIEKGLLYEQQESEKKIKPFCD